uniref:AAA+ ATPase domain-containing protein n=1 Tax=Daphnia galeata TaxID=27404 RepID=A0A8J2RQH7_9CRUS|nr:unnamed protein product [Daphnia galeata]
MKKVLELYESSQVKHGLMLVGPSGSGKSSALRILFKSLERLEGTEGVAIVIDRKATTKEALFGVLDPDTHQWTDGPFTRILRNIINNVREEINKRHWIIFHGDVDPELVENLDSVLDSNKLLTLPNGERLPVPPNVRIMFEVQDLKYATLATKSRWGRVWFSEDDLTPQMLLKHYLARLRHVPLEEVQEDTVRTPSATNNIQFQKEVAGILKPYFSPDGLVVRALEHAATRLEHINFTRFWALKDLFSMLDQSVRTILNYNCTHQDFPMDPDGHDPFYSKALVYAILCSFAGDGNLKARKNLSEFLQGLTPIKLPSPTMLIIDYKVKIGEERISVFKSASDGSGNS